MATTSATPAWMGNIDWGSILGTGASLYGAYQSANAANQSRNQLTDAASRMGAPLPGSTITGIGGAGGVVNPGGTGGGYTLGGTLDKAQQGLGAFGLAALGGVNGAGQLNPATVSAGNNSAYYANTGVGANTGGLDFMQPAVQGAFTNASQALNSVQANGFQRGLQNTAFTGAAQQAAAAGGDFSGARDSTLATLRAQAAPQETKAWQQLQNDQFSTGRMGTTGGGVQTEAFARGLAGADLDRQLAANGEARNQQTQALQQAQGLSGIGNQTQSLEQQLLQNAFSNFGTTFGLGTNLSGQQFNQQLGANQANMANSTQNLQNQLALQQAPGALQQQQLQLALSGLGGANALQTSGMDQFKAALAAAGSGASAINGANSNSASLLGAASGMPTSGDMWGQVLTGLGSRAANGDYNWLGDLFGGASGLPASGSTTTGSNPLSTGSSAAAGAGPGSLGGGSLSSTTGAAIPADLGSMFGGFGDDPSGIGYMTPTQTKVGDGSTGDAPGATGGKGVVGYAGDALGVYNGIKQGDAAGYASAAGSAASAAGYNIPGLEYAGAINQVAKGDAVGGAYSAAITYAGGPAAIGNAIASIANKQLTAHGDENRNTAAWQAAFPETQVWRLGGRTGATVTVLPGGKVVSSEDAQKLSGAYFGATYAPDGDQAGWQKKYEDLQKSIPASDLYYFQNGKLYSKKTGKPMDTAFNQAGG